MVRPQSIPQMNPARLPAPTSFTSRATMPPDGDGVVWKKGFWTKSQAGWSWVPSQWIHQPEGWSFQEGYWDRTLEDRGTVFAPAEVTDAARAGALEFQPVQEIAPEQYGQIYGAFGRVNSNYDGYPGYLYDNTGRYYGYANYGSLGTYSGYLDYPYSVNCGYPYLAQPVASNGGYSPYPYVSGYGGFGNFGGGYGGAGAYPYYGFGLGSSAGYYGGSGTSFGLGIGLSGYPYYGYGLGSYPGYYGGSGFGFGGFGLGGIGLGLGGFGSGLGGFGYNNGYAYNRGFQNGYNRGYQSGHHSLYPNYPGRPQGQHHPSTTLAGNHPNITNHNGLNHNPALNAPVNRVPDHSSAGSLANHRGGVMAPAASHPFGNPFRGIRRSLRIVG